jgi:hypothetical protein
MTEFVCTWCDVWCRVERNQYDKQGRTVICGTACAYCGRSEIRFGKLGRQTPIPAPPEPSDGFPF